MENEPQPSLDENNKTPQVTSPKHNTDSLLRLPLMIIVIIILVFISLFSGWLIGKRDNSKLPIENIPTVTPSQIPTVQTEQTTNWKTYQNTLWNISFRYPEDWEYDESVNNNNPARQYLQVTLAEKGKLPPPGTLPNIQIQYVKSINKNDFSIYTNSQKLNTIEISGIQGEVRQTQDGARTAIIISDGKTLLVSSQYASTIHKNAYDLLLTTIKLGKIVSTANSNQQKSIHPSILTPTSTFTPIGKLPPKSEYISLLSATMTMGGEWTVNEEQDSDGNPFVWITTSYSNILQSGKPLPWIGIGVNNPFSETDSLCSGYTCTVVEKLDIATLGGKYQEEVTEAKSNGKVVYYAFKVTFPYKKWSISSSDAKNLTVYAAYRNEQDKTILLKMLSALKQTSTQ